VGFWKECARFAYRLPRNLMICLVRIYRFFLSPDHSVWARALDKTPYCKHFPSCSTYALESFEKHGVMRGGFYAVRRLLSCNPWSK